MYIKRYIVYYKRYIFIITLTVIYLCSFNLFQALILVITLLRVLFVYIS